MSRALRLALTVTAVGVVISTLAMALGFAGAWVARFELAVEIAGAVGFILMVIGAMAAALIARRPTG